MVIKLISKAKNYKKTKTLVQELKTSKRQKPKIVPTIILLKKENTIHFQFLQ